MVKTEQLIFPLMISLGFIHYGKHYRKTDRSIIHKYAYFTFKYLCKKQITSNVLNFYIFGFLCNFMQLLTSSYLFYATPSTFTVKGIFVNINTYKNAKIFSKGNTMILSDKTIILLCESLQFFFINIQRSQTIL